MNGFTKKSVGTLTLGERLRSIRSDKRITLNDVAKITKIRLEYLENLEAGNYDKLPVDVYVKGFLRSYGEFLGMNGDSLIRLYEKEKGIKRNLEESKKPRRKKKESVNISSFVFTPRKLVIAFIVVLIFLSFFYLYREIGSFASVPRLVLLNPPAASETLDASLNVEGITDKDATLFINGQPVLVGDDGKFKESVTLQPGINVINIKAVNRFKKEKTETVSVQFNPSDSSNEARE